MSGTLYRPDRPKTLADLLDPAYMQDTAPIDIPQPSAASSTAGAENSSAQVRQQKLLDVLLKPDDVGEEPKVEKPKLIAQIFNMLGDAASAYAAGLSRDPGYRTSSFKQYMARIDKQRADLEDYKGRKAQSESEAKKRTAQYLLGELERGRTSAAAKADREEAAKGREAEARAGQRAQMERDAATADREAKAASTKMQFDREMFEAKSKHETSLARLHDEVRDGDKIAVQQQEALGKATEYVIEVANSAAAALAEGKITPQEIEVGLRRRFDILGLTGPAREAAEAYAKREIGPMFMDLMNQQLEAGSPQAETGGAAEPSIPQRLGSVRVPQRY